MTKMVSKGSYVLILLCQVLLTTQGCTDGIQSCFRHFDPRLTSLGGSGPGVCDLVADNLDCLTMVRQSCNPGSEAVVDGPINSLQTDYSNCTFDNLGETGYEVTQCTKLFGDCQAYISDPSCTRINSLETCSEGLSTFCTSDHLQNVTAIINSEKDRLTAEQGCVFATVTTQRVLLSGNDCFKGFQVCSQGQTSSNNPCVLVPIYQACFQSHVSGVCDAASSSIVNSIISDKQVECDALTTRQVITTTSSPQTTTIPLQTTVFQQETTTTMIPQTTTGIAQETTGIAQETTTVIAQETTTTILPKTTDIAQETTTATKTTISLPKTTTIAKKTTTISVQETQTVAPETTSMMQETTVTRQTTQKIKETTMVQETPSNQSTGYSLPTSEPTKTESTVIKEPASTMETVVVSEIGPGQIHLYYGAGANLRCTELVLIFGFAASLVLALDIVA